MDYKTLGANIRKHRLMQGMKQEELAERCDCSSSHIGQIENARGIPSLEMTVRIANALDVTVDQLLSTSYKKPEIIYLHELALRIEKYPMEQKIRACEALKSYLDSLEKFVQK